MEAKLQWKARRKQTRKMRGLKAMLGKRLVTLCTRRASEQVLQEDCCWLLFAALHLGMEGGILATLLPLHLHIALAQCSWHGSSCDAVHRLSLPFAQAPRAQVRRGVQGRVSSRSWGSSSLARLLDLLVYILKPESCCNSVYTSLSPLAFLKALAQLLSKISCVLADMIRVRFGYVTMLVLAHYRVLPEGQWIDCCKPTSASLPVALLLGSLLSCSAPCACGLVFCCAGSMPGMALAYLAHWLVLQAVSRLSVLPAYCVSCLLCSQQKDWLC